MNPFTHCIGCHSPISAIKVQGNLAYQTCLSKNCKTEFSQYYNKPEDYEEIAYFKFSVEKFFVYVYLEGYYSIMSDTVYVYSFAELKANGHANPIMTIPMQNFKPSDLLDPKNMENKIKTLITFS